MAHTSEQYDQAAANGLLLYPEDKVAVALERIRSLCEAIRVAAENVYDQEHIINLARLAAEICEAAVLEKDKLYEAGKHWQTLAEAKAAQGDSPHPLAGQAISTEGHSQR